MNIIEIILLAISLSMDAFAVALCKGLALKKIDLKSCAIVGLWFGAFQGLMPLLGYLLGSTFADKINSIDHWIAFVLLALIGGNMIKESFDKDEENVNCSLGAKAMLVMAIATSIDALAVGVSFAFTDFEPDWFVYIAFTLIGIITFSLSSIGVKIGNIFGTKYKSKAEFAGGLILILLGLKILLEGLGVIK
ncbi:MAG: manganese efflux pump [Ruminococcaceae bacterium]|nr:manganese efflux pump [Oscillospiraceae bacterium]